MRRNKYAHCSTKAAASLLNDVQHLGVFNNKIWGWSKHPNDSRSIWGVMGSKSAFCVETGETRTSPAEMGTRENHDVWGQIHRQIVANGSVSALLIRANINNRPQFPVFCRPPKIWELTASYSITGYSIKHSLSTEMWYGQKIWWIRQLTTVNWKTFKNLQQFIHYTKTFTNNNYR